ncbi:MAG: hemerythrin domain-containing protein [Bacteroidales bacterium]|nr:hemerythrin domain-containing protein [Bacteroidales bacterium]
MQLFQPTMKMAYLIEVNHNLILTLPRFNIPLGFGDRSIRDVCKANNVPEDLLLLVCNIYTFDNYLPTDKELSDIDMSLLIPYLQASHRYYIDERLPHIGRHLHNMTKRIDTRYGTMLEKFYHDYQAEVKEHFDHEEVEVFPYLLDPHKMSTNFMLVHDTLVDKLSDLTQIVYKYLPSDTLPDETIELVFDILQLSSDLKKHALIEEKVLVPYSKIISKAR